MNFVEENCARLERGIAQCVEVLGVPRRLGADATDKELADDKRTARRVHHRLVVALEDWNGWNRDGGWKTAKVPPDGTGARMLWHEWWEQWRERAIELRQQADERAHQHAIDRELEGIAQVLGDLR